MILFCIFVSIFLVRITNSHCVIWSVQGGPACPVVPCTLHPSTTAHYGISKGKLSSQNITAFRRSIHISKCSWGCLLPVVCEQDQSCCLKDHFSVLVILSLIYYYWLSGRSKKNVEWTFHCTAFSKEFGGLRIFKYYARQLLKITATTSKIVDSDKSTGRFQSDLFQMEDYYL